MAAEAESLAPAEVAYRAALAACDYLPGEIVAVWLKHRAALKALPRDRHRPVWDAAVEQTVRVGKMSRDGAERWLRRCIEEETRRQRDARRWGR